MSLENLEKIAGVHLPSRYISILPELESWMDTSGPVNDLMLKSLAPEIPGLEQLMSYQASSQLM